MDTDAGHARPAAPATRQGDSIALSAFFDGHPVATFAIDTDHVVTHWNSACEQLLGFTAAEMVGTRDHWKAFYPQPRACLADLLVADDIAFGESELYQGKLQRSVVICVGLLHVRLEIVLVGDGRIAHGLARLLQPKALSELVEIRAVCRVTEMVGDRAAV